MSKERELKPTPKSRVALTKSKNSQKKIITQVQKKQQQILSKEPSKKDPELTTQPIKVVFIGDGNSGKTSALMSYATDKFNQEYIPTIFDTYETIIKKGQDVAKLFLWDTAGQDQYKKLRSLSYPRTDVFLICFSLIEKKSFTNAINKWFNEVRQSCPRTEIIFVGTKLDLFTEYVDLNKTSSILDPEKILKKVSSMGCKLLLCSALTQDGLNSVFDTVVDLMLKKRQTEKQLLKIESKFDCQLI